MESGPVTLSEVGQLTSKVDTGQLQNKATATPTTRSPRLSRVADQRSRLNDQSGRKIDPSGVSLGLYGSGEAPEDWNETWTASMDAASERGGTSSIWRQSRASSATDGTETKSRTTWRRSILSVYRRYSTSFFVATISVTSFLSPIVMVCLPLGGGGRTALDGSTACDPDCEGLLISLSFKLVILLVGTWALFAGRPQASVPRLSVFRSLVLFSAGLLTLSYWLFYGVRIVRPGVKDFRVIVGFASSLVDALLFVHYLAVLLLRIRPVIGGQFVVKIVRSPDGESKSYSVGPMSIQSLAVCCLQHYYRDFPVYSPLLDRSRRATEMQLSPVSATEFKLYSVDDAPSPPDPASPDATAGPDAGGAMDRSAAEGPSASSPGCLARRRRDSAEQLREWQRKLERRRSRLIWETEEAFSRVAKADGTGEGKPDGSASVQEASEVVFGWLSRPLHRYLRLLFQQPPYSKQAILDHISVCITHELSARSFLERYLRPTPVGLAPQGWTGGFGKGDLEGENEWGLVCDKLLNASVENGTCFEMRREPVRILVTVREIPYLCLTQKGLGDSKRTGFVLRPSGQMTRQRTL